MRPIILTGIICGVGGRVCRLRLRIFLTLTSITAAALFTSLVIRGTGIVLI
jgi:hypothetical protein